jgi:hypothetical protein
MTQGIFPPSNYSKKDLIANYRARKTQILQVKDFFASIVPPHKHVEIEFTDDHTLARLENTMTAVPISSTTPPLSSNMAEVSLFLSASPFLTGNTLTPGFGDTTHLDSSYERFCDTDLKKIDPDQFTNDIIRRRGRQPLAFIFYRPGIGFGKMRIIPSAEGRTGIEWVLYKN